MLWLARYFYLTVSIAQLKTVREDPGTMLVKQLIQNKFANYVLLSIKVLLHKGIISCILQCDADKSVTKRVAEYLLHSLTLWEV